MSWEFKVPNYHLISGLVIRYYSDDYPYTMWKTDSNPPRYSAKDNGGNIMKYRFPRTVMMDIDTVYITNPLETELIYKPIEPVYSDTGLRYSSNTTSSSRAIGNDVYEVKFPPGVYLMMIQPLIDVKSGATTGILFGGAPFHSNQAWTDKDITTFTVGNGYAHGIWADASTNNKSAYHAISKQYASVNSFCLSLGGSQRSTIYTDVDGVLIDDTGDYMVWDRFYFGVPNWGIEINHKWDQNAQCCVHGGDCSMFINDHMCKKAVDHYCSENPTVDFCRKESFTNKSSNDCYCIFIIILIMIAIICINYPIKEKIPTKV